MENQISILFDVYHLYHLAQFDPLIDLLENDDRFKIFFSTSSKNRKEEIEICTSILNKRKGSFIFHENEDIRKTKIKKLNLDVFICGWSRYEIESYVSKKAFVPLKESCLLTPSNFDLYYRMMAFILLRSSLVRVFSNLSIQKIRSH